MRFMKRLLTAVYLYLGVFFALCLFFWILTGEEPAALIAGISTAAGVESVIAGCIRMREMLEERKRETEKRPSGEKNESAACVLPEKKDTINPAWGEK